MLDHLLAGWPLPNLRSGIHVQAEKVVSPPEDHDFIKISAMPFGGKKEVSHFRLKLHYFNLIKEKP